MIRLLSLFFIFSVFLSQSQELEWKSIQTFPIEKEAVWTVDGIGNVIITKRDQLTKYGPNGKVIFEQSQKSIGRLDKIEPFNTLKFVAFSEQQQTLCFFDNSLTFMDRCIELADYDIIDATHFANSGQSDKIWVFDQVNSTLRLLSLNGLNQDQGTKNLMGILNSESITQMIEIENKLFFLDTTSGVFIFDLYGTLINKIEKPNLKWLQFKADNALLLSNTGLIIYNYITGKEETIALPKGEFHEFIFDGNSIYFRSDTTIQKFEFLLAK